MCAQYIIVNDFADYTDTNQKKTNILPGLTFRTKSLLEGSVAAGGWLHQHRHACDASSLQNLWDWAI